jgi:hypothetical protein
MREPWTEPAPGPEDPGHVPSSHRRGLGDGSLVAWPELATETWRRRHSRGPAATEPDRRFRCRCPGWTNDAAQVDCGERANAEDLLCGWCRLWCYAIDDRTDAHLTFLQLFGQSPRRTA